MPTITKDYVESVPQIYRDILATFPRFNAVRGPGSGLAFHSIWSLLDDFDYTEGEVEAACRELARNGVVEIKNEIFVHPTAAGERLIEAITGHGLRSLPPFPPLPGE
jgi:hypothetical protein